MHSVSITDVAGRLITNIGSVTVSKNLDAPELSSGIYLLEIKEDIGLKRLLRIIIDK